MRRCDHCASWQPVLLKMELLVDFLIEFWLNSTGWLKKISHQNFIKILSWSWFYSGAQIRQNPNFMKCVHCTYNVKKNVKFWFWRIFRVWSLLFFFYLRSLNPSHKMLIFLYPVKYLQNIVFVLYTSWDYLC